jgi:DNA-binding NtrC family response regulator
MKPLSTSQPEGFESDAANTASLSPLPEAERIDIVYILDGQSVVRPLPTSGRWVLGRGRDADLCILHTSLSRAHAALTMPELTLEDLGSTNGTFVRRPAEDGRLIDVPVPRGAPVQVRCGDTLRLGAVTMVLVPTYLSGHKQRERPSRPLVVEDDAMRRLYARAARVAAGDLPVLIVGETGVGKEALARWVHRRSPRAARALRRITCAAMSEGALDALLAARDPSAKPATLDATSPRDEPDAGETVLFDEIGDLSLASQGALLRLLEAPSTQRSDDIGPMSAAVRVIATTQRDLATSVAAGTFRSDLYFRLAGVVLEVPPLRERKGEILALAEYFAQSTCEHFRRSATTTFSDEARAFLLSYEWPGNVRELAHTIERAVLLCDGSTIDREHLALSSPSRRAADAPTRGEAHALEETTFEARRHRAPKTPGLTRAAIEEALERCAGNQTRAASLLGISRRTLVTWLDRFDIARPRSPRDPQRRPS